MIPVCVPSGPQAKLGQKLVPSYLAVVSKIPKAAHMASLFCWGSYHSQPGLSDYDNIATVPQVWRPESSNGGGEGQIEDFILTRPGSWPSTDSVYSTQRSKGNWRGSPAQGPYSYLSVVRFNLLLLLIQCRHIGDVGRDF